MQEEHSDCFAGDTFLVCPQATARDADSIHHSKRRISDATFAAKQTRILDAIGGMMFHWKRWEIIPARVVSELHIILEW